MPIFVQVSIKPALDVGVSVSYLCRDVSVEAHNSWSYCKLTILLTSLDVPIGKLEPCTCLWCIFSFEFGFSFMSDHLEMIVMLSSCMEF